MVITGKPEEAIQILEAPHVFQPNDRELLYRRATFQRDRGDLETARRYAQQRLMLAPQDPAVRQWVNQLQVQ